MVLLRMFLFLAVALLASFWPSMVKIRMMEVRTALVSSDDGRSSGVRGDVMVESMDGENMGHVGDTLPRTTPPITAYEDKIAGIEITKKITSCFNHPESQSFFHHPKIPSCFPRGS
ncbi:hypothetical protein COCNU_05G006740 [Cocos nucifera]|uniref:Uncharacterized protein n=1 Tax=Cocos nucifera TaxID=13894 RepID=A0A8K0N1M2_COCNU|nr:hypothetical protein COCNU_05G006740 [Cocos nucifera]